MPYIRQEKRIAFREEGLERLRQYMSDTTPSAGDMNYVITELLLHYASETAYKALGDDFDLKAKGLPYETINAVVGILECAKQEFYRRAASPKEDLAIRENGDVHLYNLVDYKGPKR
jgi:hypothetical protein